MEPAIKRRKLASPPIPTTKICTSCNTAKPLDQFSRSAKNADGLQYDCKPCGAERKKRYANTKQGFICLLVSHARCNSKRRGHGPPTITYDTIKSLAENGRCALSGVPIKFKQHSSWQASLDRIDDDKGYQPDNVRLVALEFNTPKKWTLAKFHAMFREDTNTLSVDLVSFEPPIETRQRRTEEYDDQERLQCWDCQVFKPLDAYYNQLSLGCKACGAFRCKAFKNTPRGRLLRLVSSARSSHNDRLKRDKDNPDRADAGPCDITFDQLVTMYKQQGGQCFYSGMPLGFSSDEKWLISLERLDVTKSYTMTNVALICAEFNAIDHGIQSGNTVQGWSKAKVDHIRELLKK